MTTLLADKGTDRALLFDSSFGAGFAAPEKKWFTKENGTFSKLSMSRVPVFRSGTFRDSWGDQYTYEPLHIQQMSDNFAALSAQKILSDVPVRCNHPGFLSNVMRDVIGYVTAVSTEEHVSPVDGQTYTYLLADYEILDEQAAKNIDSTLWRNRSSEVGTFRTNQEAEYWPVLVGFAYVDIPAVEGLNYAKKADDQSKFPIMFEKEMPLMADNDKGGASSTNTTSGEPGATSQQFTAPAPHAFTIAGQQVTDFAAVQARLDLCDTLEGFAKETKAANRMNFVSGLASSNKILETQKPGLEEFVRDLSDSQYEAWTKTWENAPVQSVLGNMATGPVQQEASSVPTADEAKITTAQAIVQQHKIAGMSDEFIKSTPSYKLLESNNKV